MCTGKACDRQMDGSDSGPNGGEGGAENRGDEWKSPKQSAVLSVSQEVSYFVKEPELFRMGRYASVGLSCYMYPVFKVWHGCLHTNMYHRACSALCWGSWESTVIIMQNKK